MYSTKTIAVKIRLSRLNPAERIPQEPQIMLSPAQLPKSKSPPKSLEKVLHLKEFPKNTITARLNQLPPETRDKIAPYIFEHSSYFLQNISLGIRPRGNRVWGTLNLIVQARKALQAENKIFLDSLPNFIFFSASAKTTLSKYLPDTLSAPQKKSLFCGAKVRALTYVERQDILSVIKSETRRVKLKKFLIKNYLLLTEQERSLFRTGLQIHTVLAKETLLDAVDVPPTKDIEALFITSVMPMIKRIETETKQLVEAVILCEKEDTNDDFTKRIGAILRTHESNNTPQEKRNKTIEDRIRATTSPTIRRHILAATEAKIEALLYAYLGNKDTDLGTFQVNIGLSQHPPLPPQALYHHLRTPSPSGPSLEERIQALGDATDPYYGAHLDELRGQGRCSIC